MSTITELPNHQERYDEASLWIAKLDRELTTKEQQELSVWMNESSENRDLLLNMAEQWDKMDSLSRLSAIFPHHPATKPVPQDGINFFHKISSWFGLALRPGFAVPAFILVAASIAFMQFNKLETEGSSGQLAYETAVGEQSSILLPDGSYMRLNTDTLVEVAYSPDQRLLNLIRGELNIDVAHDTNRPLRVQANGRVVEAVGTAFNVEITEDHEVELVVTEGKVVVTLAQHIPESVLESGQTVSATDISPSTIAEPIAVSAGEEILLGSENQELRKILPAETVVKLSWQQGNLVFRGESLEEAMAEVGRYTPVEFVFLDEKCKHVRIAGLFKAGDTENLLSALRENFNVTYEWVGSDKVLLSSL